MIFKDNNSSVFTLKQGKSYNMTKYEHGFFFKKYCFTISNYVSTDVFVLKYNNKLLRNSEYENFVSNYLTFNGMNDS